MKLVSLVALVVPAVVGTLNAGPYSLGADDPANPHDAPVPGFLGPHGIGKAKIETGELDENWDPIYANPDNFVNPLFFGWGETVIDYSPSDVVSAGQADPDWGLGPVTGDHVLGVVSLGDLNEETILTDPPGTITLELDQPVQNGTGNDFVVFENGYASQHNLGGSGIGGIFAELAYVEVSGDGSTFVRFPATSLTNQTLSAYSSMDPTDVHNLAGKHVNAYGDSWGTPFDLDDVGLSRITHVRIIDIPGEGAFLDQFDNPIYDPWYPLGSEGASGTFGSGGFDLDAIGGISVAMSFSSWPQLEPLAPSDRDPGDDPDGDGFSNLLEYAFARLPWKADAGNTVGCSASGTDSVLTFVRDERLADLTYEVQRSASLTGSWTTIAVSSGGAPVAAVSGFSPVVTESSASQITGIGVIREVRVRDAMSGAGDGRRFYRVRVSRQSS